MRVDGGPPRGIGFALVERVASSLLHSIANPMNVILGRAGMLEMMRPGDAELSRAVGEIRRQIEKASLIATELQDFVSVQARGDEPRSLAGELELVVGALRSRAEAADVRLEIGPLDPKLDAPVQGTALYDMLYGVLGFAIETAPRGALLKAEFSRMPPQPPRNVTCALLTVTLPQSSVIPTNKRELMSPWLAGPVRIPEARLLLAIGIGAAQARDGWHELEAKDATEQTLRIYLPLSSAA